MHETDDAHVVIRPHLRVFWSAVISTLILVIPVWGVAFWLTGPGDTDGRAWVIVTGALGTAVLITAAVLGRRRQIVVGHDGFVERPFIGPTTTIRRQDIGRTFFVELSHRGSEATTAQLFVCDAQNRPVLRMRSDVWSRDAIVALLAAYDGPIERLKRPITIDELRSDHPSLLNWVERLPWARPETF